MSIFDIFRTQPKENHRQSEPKDQRKAECPYCHSVLKKIPGAKTKCPHCGESMFVRTRPDGVRLVVTKDEADKIDEEWRIENGTQDAFLADKKKFDDQKEALRKKFGGKEPSNHDVQWSLLNEEIISTASNAQWGLYRNARFQMAEILDSEHRYKEALKMYFGVCYLDLNGATNVPTDEHGKAIFDTEYFKPFDPELKFLAPGVVSRMRKIIEREKIDKVQAKELYLNFATIEQRGTRAPIAPMECFGELERELWNA